MVATQANTNKEEEMPDFEPKEKRMTSEQIDRLIEAIENLTEEVSRLGDYTGDVAQGLDNLPESRVE